MQRDEARVAADLRDVARPRESDVEARDRSRRRTGRQHDHAIRQRDRLVEVVRDEEDGLALRLPQVEQLVLHQLARLDVERRERLVHQHEVGVEDERLRERDALLHAARQLVRIAVLEAGEPDTRKPFARLRVRDIARDTAELEPCSHVAQRIAPRHQRVGLEHVARASIDGPATGVEPRAERVDIAGRRREQSGSDVQQRRLAATGRADDRHELAGRDVQRHVVEHRVTRCTVGVRRERAADALKRERRIRHARCRRRRDHRYFRSACFAKSFVNVAARSIFAGSIFESNVDSAFAAVRGPDSGISPSGEYASRWFANAAR